MTRTWRYISVCALALFSACTGKLKIEAKSGAITPTDSDFPATLECPGGMRGTVALMDGGASVTSGQSTRFQVSASGCLYGYLIYPHGASNAVFFRDSTTYSRSFLAPVTGANESVEIVTLDKNLQPASHYTLTTRSPFDVVQGTGLSCNVEPRVYTLSIPLDANRQPAINTMPVLSFRVRSNAGTTFGEVIPPAPSDFEVTSRTPASGSSVDHTIAGNLRVLRSGSYQFMVEDGAGGRVRCASDLIINYVTPANVSTRGSVPQYYFRADVTGDDLDDVVARDLVTGKIIVAVGNSDGSFSQREFGYLPPEEIYVNPLFADFNGDGRHDILIQVASTGNWMLLFSDGSRFANVNIGPWPAGSLPLTNIAVGDPNKDGKPDIVGMNGGSNYVSYLTINGTSVTMAVPVLQPPVLTVYLSPVSVPYNGTSQFAWDSENTASCRLKRNGAYVTLPAGSQQDGLYVAASLTADATFVLECLSAGTPVTTVTSSPLTVTVQPPPTPGLTLFVKETADDAAPEARYVDPNGTVQLRWSTQNVTSCRMLQGSTELSTERSHAYRASNPIAANTDFRLSCVSVAGATVSSPAQTVQVIADLGFTAPSPINFGTVNFGAVSTTQQITIKNPMGRAPATNVTVELPAGFVFGGGTCVNAANTAFSVAPTATADKTCTYLIKFQPVADTAEQTEKVYAPADVRVTYHNGKAAVTEVAGQVKGTGAKPAATK